MKIVETVQIATQPQYLEPQDTCSIDPRAVVGARTVTAANPLSRLLRCRISCTGRRFALLRRSVRRCLLQPLDRRLELGSFRSALDICVKHALKLRC